MVESRRSVWTDAVVSATALAMTLLVGAPFAAGSNTTRKAAVRASTGSLPTRDLGMARRLGSPAGPGPIGSIELNVDGFDDGENASVFTFGGDTVYKAGFGNRFTLTANQTPFALKQAAAFLIETIDGVGFEPGQEVSITVLVDATSSGDINDAVVVRNDTFTLGGLGFIAFEFPEPVIVQQGDIYIIFTDLNDDADDTPIPILLLENGGVGDGRAYTTLSTPGTPNPTIQSGYFRFADLATPILGNCIVRGFGDPALPTDTVTGGGEPVDAGLPTPTGLSVVGSSSDALTWTAPALPPPPTPVVQPEAEPNDSPGTAQDVGPNAVVNGSASSTDGGSPGGFGTDDVEDWFAFTLSETRSVDIDLTGFGGTDFDLLLYDAAGPFTSNEAIAVSGGGVGEEEHISIAVLPAGSYRVAVTAFGDLVPAPTNYTLSIVASKKVNRYNVYRGASADFTPSASTFFGSIPGGDTAFTVLEGSPGAYYRVTAVVGTAQSTGSNAANAGPDTAPPLVTCPPTIVVPAAPGQCSAQVNYPMPAVSDNLPGATVACLPPSGNTLAVGTTPVLCVATDVAGNTSQCSFALVVADTQAPSVACPSDITVVVPTSSGLVVTYATPAAADNCPGAATVCVPPSGSFFAFGTTAVTCTATDASGNASACGFTVSVRRPIDSIGVYVAETSTYFLRNSNSPGAADYAYGYGAPGFGLIAVTGDWDSSGTDTPGVFYPANRTFFLKNTHEPGGADIRFRFTTSATTVVPVTGDWNGDGIDTTGLYVPSTKQFQFRNANTAGSATLSFTFNPGTGSFQPIIGDWDGNGTDTTGLYKASNGTFFLRNANSTGGADVIFAFGPSGGIPISGDWNGDGITTIGVYVPATGTFYLRNSNSAGAADLVIAYGPVGVIPLAGDWDNQ